MKETVLALGAGGTNGAFGAGASIEIINQLGLSSFKGIYASSAGAYTSALLAAGQAEVCEAIWRGHVNGRKLINFFRPWNALNLGYLEKILRSGPLALDVEAVFRSQCKLKVALTRFRDGAAVYLRPKKNDIFDVMSASAAIPFLHPAVQLIRECISEWFVDGAFVDPLPVLEALKDGAQLVVAISNNCSNYQIPNSFYALGMLCKFVSSEPVSRLVHNYGSCLRGTEEILSDSRVIVIRPLEPLSLKGPLDTNQMRLNAAFDQGRVAARKAIAEIRRRIN
jgi:predicted patatin/cPLA2 family phospholipase